MAITDILSNSPFLSGTKTKITPTSLLSPNQQKFQDWSLGAAQKGIMNSFDFGPIAEAAQNRFQQQTLPSIAERFGGMGAQRSSAHNQAFANAQRDLQLDLAGQQQQFNQQSQKTWADILGQGLRPSQENIVEQGQQPGWIDLLSKLGPLLLRGYLAYQSGGGSELAKSGGDVVQKILGAGGSDLGQTGNAAGGGLFDWLFGGAGQNTAGGGGW